MLVLSSGTAIEVLKSVIGPRRQAQRKSLIKHLEGLGAVARDILRRLAVRRAECWLHRIEVYRELPG